MLTAMFDAPTRIKVTLEDGTVREFVALAFEVEGVVKARRPAAAASEAPKNGATPSGPIAERPDQPIDGDTARSWLKGECDAAVITPENLGKLLAVVNFLRRSMFKISVATMTTVEAKAVRAAWQDGAKPSAFCRAVVNASRDAFWIEKGDIRVQSIVSNLGALSKPRAAATTTSKMNEGRTS